MEEQRIVELLTRKIAGEATPEELGELSYLLSKYPDSVYYEALMEQVWDLGEENEEQLQKDFERHLARSGSELRFEKDRRGVSGIFKRPAALFAVVATIFVVTVAIIFGLNQAPKQEEEVVIVSGLGVRKELRLPDGTIVRLNSDSRLSYNPKFKDQDTREVLLTGEAYFNVSHDKQHPFIVKTSKVRVRVLGTEFNVKEYPGEGESETTLLKGSVELSINSRADQKFVLKPSEKFALVQRRSSDKGKEANSTMIIENISPVKLGDKEYIREVTWTENKLVFQNESFNELIPKLERWYNVKIDLSDPGIGSYRYTGIFIDENIVQALEAMKIIKPFNYKMNENEVKIY